MKLRIIPHLGVKGDRLVKGVHLEGLRQLGDPADFARTYYLGGCDELVYQDVVASLYARSSLLPLLERTADEVFVPITVGGGMRSLGDIRAALRAGADRVAINTAALRDPDFLALAASTFAPSTLVLSIEAKRRGGSYEAYTDAGRERTGHDAVQWAADAQAFVSEILLTSIDHDGTGRGCDLELLRLVRERVSVPVVVHGGVGSVEHVAEAARAGAAGVAIASMLHYGRESIDGVKRGLEAMGIETRRAA